MTFRKILKWPDQSLREVSDEASLDDKIIVGDLLDTFRVVGGYGLSAPQIGFKKRIIVINEDLLKGEDKGLKEKIMINPSIVRQEGKKNFKESCFSIEEATFEVERFSNIEFTYTSVNGDLKKESASGYHAVCIQHEIDHLNGILMLDKLSNLKKTMFLKKKKKSNLKRKREKNLEIEQPKPGFRKKKRK